MDVMCNVACAINREAVFTKWRKTKPNWTHKMAAEKRGHLTNNEEQFVLF